MRNYRENTYFLQTKSFITRVIDFFYPPFANLMPRKTFRYLASGGSNFVLDILIYFISYNFILEKQDIALTQELVISAPIFAFIISFSICFPYGFLMSKFVVFQESNIKGRIQLFRYLVVVGINILLNYILMKLFVEVAHFYPTVSRTITAILVAVFSYIVNQRFAFGTSKNANKIREAS